LQATGEHIKGLLDIFVSRYFVMTFTVGTKVTIQTSEVTEANLYKHN